MTTTENLWPDFDVELRIKSSKKILLEQADFFMKATQSILVAKVETNPHTTNYNADTNNYQVHFIDHNFNIIAPELNGYAYTLFILRQEGLNMYPCSLFFDGKEIKIDNEGILVTELKKTFSHQSTKDVVTSLLALSKDNKPSN